MGRNGDVEPVLDIRPNGPFGGTLGRVGPRRRRRHRRLEVAPEVELPDPRRHDSDGRRRRVLRRRGRKLLCARCRQQRETLEPGSRRRHRRRRDHLHGERRAKGRSGGRLPAQRPADEERPGPERRSGPPPPPHPRPRKRVAMSFPCHPVEASFFDTAPVHFKNAVEVEARPAEVFAIFEDGESWPQWFSVIRKVVWTSNRPYGVGTTRTVWFPLVNIDEYFF